MHQPSHQCDAIVITCMDFRIHNGKAIPEIQKATGLKIFDVVSLPGGAKNLVGRIFRGRLRVRQMLTIIALSKRLHGIRSVVLVNHTDCGAYGEAGTLEKLQDDLLRARDRVQTKYPELMVYTLIAHVTARDGDWIISCQRI